LEIRAETKLPNGKTLIAQGVNDKAAVEALRAKVDAAKKFAEVRAEYPKSVKVEW
jgi:hypothetical protein